MIHVFVVRKNPGTPSEEIHSAWTDEYAAKFEAGRWQQDSKIPHDYVPGFLHVRIDSEELIECSLV